MSLPKEQIINWFSRIQKAEDFQSKRHEAWNQIMKLYKGEFFSKPTDNSGEITEVNFTFEYVRVLVSAIYAKDPYIFARANIGKRAAFAEIMEFALNYYWRELKMKQKIKSCIASSVLTPPGFIELGYMFVKEIKDEFTKQLEEEFPELVQQKDTKPLEKQGIFDDTVKEDDIFVKPHTAWKVLFPDGYHNIRESPWMAIVDTVPLLDIKSNPLFSKAKNNINPGIANSPSNNSTSAAFNLKRDVPLTNMNGRDNLDEENIPVDLYYIFDRRSQRRFVIVKGLEEALFDKEWKYLPEGFPLFPLIFNEIPATKDNSHAYPLPDVVPLLPQLKELSKINSAMMRHRKRAGTLILGRKGAVSEEEVTNIQQANDVDIVLMDNIDENSVKTFTPPSLPPDFYRIRDTIMQDLLRISGLPQLLSGGNSGVETATESENIRLGATLIQSEKVDTIEEFTKDIARYMAGLIWQFKSRRDIEEIYGEPLSEEMWPSLPKKEDGEVDINKARRIIQKEIHFYIEAGSTRPPKDENVERKLWMDLVTSVKQMFPGRLNDGVILPQLLKKFDFKDIDQAVISFDEEEAQVAEQENQLLLQGIPVPVSPNQNHKIHAQIHANMANQGQSSPQLDQHLLEHVSREEQQSPGGDGRNRKRNTSADVRRRGVPENVDFVGASNTPQRGINRGGG